MLLFTAFVANAAAHTPTDAAHATGILLLESLTCFAAYFYTIAESIAAADGAGAVA